MDVIRTRHSTSPVSPDEPRRTPPKCCPFCLGETLLTSWDTASRCLRYQCSGCFEVFGRLAAPAAEAAQASGQLVQLEEYRRARLKERG
jgi:hypothetical protein